MGNTETTLVVRRDLTPATWQMISEIAPVMHQSRLFGVTSKEAAVAIMLKGYELGLPITASFEFIQVVQGKPSLSPRGALAIILQCGQLDGLKIEDRKDPQGKPVSCYVWMKRKNGLEYSMEYTYDDAKRTGQVKAGSAWETYPGNMLRWKAVGFVADVVFPDIIGGLKRADEFGAPITPDGDVVEGEWTTTPVTAATVEVPAVSSVATAPAPSAPVTTERTMPTVTLDALLERYGAEAIVVAGEGKLPETDAELAILAQKLGGI